MDVSAYAWIGWLVLILAFVIIEMVTLSLLFLMLAIGSLGGLLSGLVGAPWWLQLLIGAAISVSLLFALRPRLVRLVHRGGDPAASNVEALLGLSGRVVVPFGETGGQVRLANGETWSARWGAEGSAGGEGTPVRVKSIEGATAVVVPVDEEGSGS